jgi:4-amino-4-deoxy-L-arabinose transferase-like glycosyltransferase
VQPSPSRRRANAGPPADGPFALANLPWLAAAAALSLLLRIPFFAVPMIADEGGYAYVAQRWLDGRGHLYHDIWVSRPQGIFGVYGTVLALGGESAGAFRFAAWIAAAAMIPLVWALAIRCGGRRIAIVATLVYAAVSGSPAIEGFTANAEVFMALPAALGAWLLLRAREQGFPAPTLVAIGILVAVATIMKPSGIVMLPVAGVFLWLAASDGPRRLAARLGWIGLGVAVGVAPALIHGWIVGWDAWLYASVTYRVTHQSSITYGLERHVLGVGALLLRVLPMLAAVGLAMRLQRRLPATAPAPALLPVSGGSHLADGDRVGRARRWVMAHPARALLWFWLGGCAAGIAMGGDWWNHYLIQVAAPFSIWLALLVVDVCGRLAGARRIAFAFGMAVVLLAPYGVALAGDPVRVSDILYPAQDLGPQDDVAAYLRTHGDPDAPIVIAFDKAAIYYLADRPAAYRYLYDQELRAIPGAEDAMIAIVSGPDRPEYVVDTLQPSPFPNDAARFWAAVEAHYEVETVIEGWTIYRARSS